LTFEIIVGSIVILLSSIVYEIVPKETSSENYF